MLTWSPPPVEDQNGIIRNYILNITELETGMAFHYASSSTSILVYSLHPFYRYVVTIAAVTVGQGPATIAFTVQTWENGTFAKYARPLIGQGTTNFNICFLFCFFVLPAPSMPPVSLAVDQVTSGSVSLHWSPPQAQFQNGIITGYLVNLTALGTPEIIQVSSITTRIVIQS